MPRLTAEQAIPDTEKSFTHDFSFKYQQFEIELMYYQANVQGINGVYVDVALRQKRAGVWEAGRITTEQGTAPFMSDVTIDGYILHRDNNIVPRDIVGHKMRPRIRDLVTQTAMNQWMYTGPEIPEDDNPDAATRRERRDNRERWRRMSTEQSLPYNLVDQINEWMVGTINTYFSVTVPCPDEVEGCATIHLNPMDHIEIWSGDQVPIQATVVMFADLDNDEIPERIYCVRQGLDNNDRGTFANLRREHNLAECIGCVNYFHRDYLNAFQLCPDCEDEYGECENCQGRMHVNEQYEIMQYDEFLEEDELLVVCIGCYDEHRREGRVALNLHNYSYKPSPNIRTKGTSTEGPTLGLELEVARENRADGNHVNRWIAQAAEDGFIYCKGDSSVHYGLEIVTHPFTYEWAQENFPFDLFDKLLKIPSILPMHRSAGTHVHMGKNGFDSAHLWKFIKFHLDCDEFAGLVGERGASADYGSLKRNKDALTKNLKEIGRLKGSNGNMLGISRSVGINLIPSDTIELRYFAGNVNPDGIRKNLDWVQAVYEFTDLVSVPNAAKGALADPGYFLGFLEDRDYTHLFNFLQQTIPTPKKLEE